MWYSYPNRTLCECLDELRALLKRSQEDKYARNTLLSLVEEIQVYANRMEASMSDAKDVRRLHAKKKKLEKKIKALEEKLGNDSDDRLSIREMLTEEDIE